MIGMLAGFVLGLAGSGHCAAMCGPLAIWVHGQAPAAAPRAGLAARYHAGRLVTYAALGAITGRSGEIAVNAGLGVALAGAIGAVLVWQAVRQAGIWPATVSVPRVAALMRWPARATSRAARWLQHHGLGGPFALGALSGLLPCGLIYAAVAAAAGLAGPVESAGFMLAFALGTSPLLLVTVWSSGRIARRLPTGVRRLAPLVLLVIAALIFARAFRAHAHDTTSSSLSAAVSEGGHIH